MKTAFFKPEIGAKYNEGFVNGKKVLILGASSYCNLSSCIYYTDCALNQNTRPYDTKCPHNNGRPLSELPQTEFDEDGARSFKRFLEYLKQFINEPDVNYIYDRVAFTNYVQHMIGGRTTTRLSDCREEYMDALIEVLETLKPDIVIVWGCVIIKPIANYNVENKTLIEDYPFFFKWNFNGKDIIFLNIYHPSSSYFYTDKEWENMNYYLNKAFNL